MKPYDNPDTIRLDFLTNRGAEVSFVDGHWHVRISRALFVDKTLRGAIDTAKEWLAGVK